MIHSKSSRQIDMCSGSLPRNILLYSIPLMFSNVLQILFNMSDIAVVGKFAGPIALGAVGSTTILVTLTTGIHIGIAGGVNALTALYLGGKRKSDVQKCVQTALLLCFFSGLLLSILGFFFSEPILIRMHTKDELLSDAVKYMMLYLCGAPALSLYNYGNAVLSAAGDTKRPLFYLTFSGILNVILNLIFVIGFHLGVIGVALATIIAQYVSAFCIIRHLLLCNATYRLTFKNFFPDFAMTKRILWIGIPSAIQYSLFAVANLFVQTAVNYFDHVVVEGNSAAANADILVYDMMAAFYTAATSFIAQNLGAGNKERILKIYKLTGLYSFITGIVLGALFFVAQRPFLSLFTNDTQVISYGMIRMTVMTLSYSVSAFMDNAVACSRGLGKSVAPTFFVIMGSVVFRIAWIYTVFAYYHTLISLYTLYVFSWAITAVAGNIYFGITYHKLKIKDPNTA